ncbi:MAG: hypothetical protein ACK4M7_06100, partial [Burkholderiales bacterium]
PQNLTMTSYNNHPKLVWQKNPEQDVDYYRIYRKIGSLPYTLHTTVSASLPTEYVDNEETVCNPSPGVYCQSGTVAKYYINRDIARLFKHDILKSGKYFGSWTESKHKTYEKLMYLKRNYDLLAEDKKCPSKRTRHEPDPSPQTITSPQSAAFHQQQFHVSKASKSVRRVTADKSIYVNKKNHAIKYDNFIIRQIVKRQEVEAYELNPICLNVRQRKRWAFHKQIDPQVGALYALDQKDEQYANKQQQIRSYRDNLKVGGKHKKFDPKTGIVYAMDNIGQADFIREGQIKTYTDNLPDGLRQQVQSVLSLQLPYPTANQEYKDKIAKVSLYKKYGALTDLLNCSPSKLTPDEARQEETLFLIDQLIYMLELLYTSNMIHCDLHADNILVIYPTYTTNNSLASKMPILKLIDFGKSRFGNRVMNNDQDKFTDLKYLLLRQANNNFETFRRNIWRKETDKKQQKHYPLHKLIGLLGIDQEQIREKLAQLGEVLIGELHVANDHDEVHQKFASFQRELSSWIISHQARELPSA